MYPGSQFIWHDMSSLNNTSATTSVIDDAPLFMQAFAADKGTEDLVEISGDDFFNMYGKISFQKYGQAGIQAANIINAGGRLYAKRVVADDSTLANIVFTATLIPANDGVNVKWSAIGITNCKTFDEVKAKAAQLYDAEGKVFPLFVISDNGRGISGKAVRVTPDYSTSRDIGKMFYNLSVYEGTVITEKKTFTFNPDTIYNDVAYGLDVYANKQITGTVLEDMYDLYVQELATSLTLDIDVIKSYDIIFGYTYRGIAIDGFVLNAESVDLDADTGIALVNGSNGAFGDAPLATEVGKAAYAAALVKVFDGTFSDEIFDVDQHKIAAIVDANYPDDVKDAIFDLVTFRQDCVFFRDFGTECNTYIDIKAKKESFSDKTNYFVADYATTYLIKDPYTFKNIKVTCTYDLAAALVSHIANNPNAPVAGTINGFILPSAIDQSINFVPINTPTGNQKELMDNLRVNYAIFEDSNCVIQSCYTAQAAYTQLSFIGNVLAIQRVIRAVRTACPRHRFALSTGSDLSNYATAVNNVLSDFITDFSTLRFIYNEDALKANQKIFYASIEFAFLNCAQTEIFDIYAINN